MDLVLFYLLRYFIRKVNRLVTTWYSLREGRGTRSDDASYSLLVRLSNEPNNEFHLVAQAQPI